jgi:Outer membrane protein beta-barrel domain
MRRLILITVLTVGTTAARADNGFFYVGAGVVRNSLTGITDLGGLPDLKNTSWKAFGGVRPLNWLAAEADYIDLGSGSGTATTNFGEVSSHTDGKAFAAFAVGFLPIPLPVIDVYGKAGLARWKLNGNVGSLGSLSTNGTEFAWGIGVQAHISMIGARLEYENFNVPNTSGASVASLSVFLNL